MDSNDNNVSESNVEIPTKMSANHLEQAINKIDVDKHRFPTCIVWTPLPLLTWIIPFIGHMGIATTSGIINDFAGPYYVSEDDMAFGWPTKYWLLDPYKTNGGPTSYEKGVAEASAEYRKRMHNLCCDNCHSHVAMALNLMEYDGSSSWNMVKLCFLMLLYSKYVSFWAFIKTWLPFCLLAGGIIVFAVFLH